MAVPSGAVPGLLDPQQRSGWQLAQEVWQDSGVVWELIEAESSGPALRSADFAEAAPAAPRPAEMGSRRAWLDEAGPADPGLAAELANAQLAAAGLANRGLAAAELTNPGLPDIDQPAGAESPDAWFDDDRSDGGYDPAGPEPADARFDDRDDCGYDPVESAPARAESAGNWFDGPGPADPRLAARRPVADRPTVVEFSAPYFADSGVVPMESEFPSTAIPRQPTFTPVDNARLPLRDRVPPGSVRDDAGQGPPRPAPPRSRGLRPEAMDEDPEPRDRIRFGSDQAPRPRRPSPGWNEYPESGYPGQAWPAGNGQVPLGAPVMVDEQAPAAVDAYAFAGPAGVGAPPLGESDELFRAWQGSVREAAAPRRSWSASRPGTSSRRRRAVQVATIGVPAAIIVAVGAGALIMLTGKADEMLAPQSNTGAASAAGPASIPPAKVTPPAFAGSTLAGYPGQRGAVTVASMQMTGGVALAVGSADGHPAIWRRSASGRWTLESAATLSAIGGRASLAAVAYGQAGWIAVGSASVGGTTQPVVLASADGVSWQPLATLAALAGQGTEFLGIAAGHGGYVVVGRQMTGGRIFAVLWYSADLRSWSQDSNGGLDGRLTASTVNAVTTTASGFVAVGSHGAGQAIWISADGRQWSPIGLNLPSGAHSATLTSVAASGDRVVAAGYADTPAGDVPVVVVSVDGGAQWRQVVLPAPDGVGVITALTATPDGFAAAGQAGKHGSVRTVTWTSQDGLTWSQPTQTADSEITALTTAGTDVVGTAEQGATPTIVTVPAP